MTSPGGQPVKPVELSTLGVSTAAMASVRSLTGNAQTSKQQFCYALDRKLAELKALVISELDASQQENAYLKRVLHHGAMPATPTSYAGADLLSPGPPITHSMPSLRSVKLRGLVSDEWDAHATHPEGAVVAEEARKEMAKPAEPAAKEEAKAEEAKAEETKAEETKAPEEAPKEDVKEEPAKPAEEAQCDAAGHISEDWNQLDMDSTLHPRKSTSTMSMSTAIAQTPSSVEPVFQDVDNIAAAKNWVSIMHKLTSPKARVARMKKYNVHPVWSTSGLGSVLEADTDSIRYSTDDVPLNSWASGSLSGSPMTAMSFGYGKHVIRFRCDSHVMKPDSNKRTIWLVLCCLLILYDLVMVPISTFFEVDEGIEFFVAVAWFQAIFWSFDIMCSFFTGIYIAGIEEMRLKPIAMAYAKTWFVFDLVIVISQWLSIALNNAGASVQSIMRGVRLMRLMRLLHFEKLRVVFESLFQFSGDGLIALSVMLKLASAFTVIVHVHGCLWYGVGRMSDDGWSSHHTVVSNSVLRNYILSVQWAAAQVYGTTRPIPLTTFEHLFATVSSWLGMFCFMFLVSHATLALTEFNNFDHSRSSAACTRFCKSNKISPKLFVRMQHYLALGHRRIGLSEQVKQDAEMLAALPSSLRASVFDEARWPIIKDKKFFKVLHRLSERTVGDLCQFAMSVSVALTDEIVFMEADPCHHVYIVQFGSLRYVDEKGWSMRRSMTTKVLGSLSDQTQLNTKKNNQQISETDYVQIVDKGSFLSEAVLWTVWEHTGKLRAICDSTMFLLDPEHFVDVIAERAKVLSYACLYASYFVKKINQARNPSDTFSFDFDSLETEGTQSLDAALDENKHLIFLSHYKAEAGTEATLMEEAFTSMIKNDQSNPGNQYKSPVFLDSANLEDLSTLRKHVENSDNLLLMLTPGVLTRPWCLVEIATAHSHGVKIVPVEIQKPGSTWRYPNDEFYKQLQAGSILSKADVDVLRGEELELSDVEFSIRQVFTQIALPFSPHKSKQIRQAELSDILDRSTRSVVTRPSSVQASTQGSFQLSLQGSARKKEKATRRQTSDLY